jgi:hypothetical protein
MFVLCANLLVHMAWHGICRAGAVLTRHRAVQHCPVTRRAGRWQLLLVALCEYQVGPQWDSGACLKHGTCWILKATQSTILEDCRVDLPGKSFVCKYVGISIIRPKEVEGSHG